MSGKNIFTQIFNHKIGRLIFIYIIALFFVFGLLLFREVYLGIFQGINQAFFIEVLRNYLVFVSIWTGSRLLFLLIDKMLPWRKYPLAGVLVQIGSIAVYSYLALGLYIYNLQGVIDENIASKERHFTLLIAYFVLNVFINFALELGKMLREWQNSVKETEALKKEVIQAQLNVLQHQLNPHFLFNTLNTLSSLVYKDSKESDIFIQQLAKVYRYVLENNGKDLVPIIDEIRFLKSFIYLIKIRYKKALEVNIRLDENMHGSIAPVSLQMLIENAVKHNVVSQKRHLIIDIYTKGNSIVVQNNLQKRSSSDASLGLGLKNIKARYQSLTNIAVQITESKEVFSVALPILPDQS